MVKPRKEKVATEAFVWRLINNLEEHMNNRFDEINIKFDKMLNHLLDIVGKFKTFDEERVVMAEKLSEHTDRIEKLEQEVFKAS